MIIKENQTFCMLKPDVIKRNLVGKVLTEIEKHFKIIKIESKQLDTLTIEEFYRDHKEKFFFKDMVKRLGVSMVIGCILEIQDNKEKDIIGKLRKIMGATNPGNAEEGTIRNMYALSIDENSVHGSDSLDNAQREAKLFFEGI